MYLSAAQMGTRGSRPLSRADAETLWKKYDPGGNGRIRLAAARELARELPNFGVDRAVYLT